ncbi:hypothetical protein TTRE_0000139701 [Trichuris trichiura]|uniref:Uncharacterized protein n=1 Tax=Trichuris trichiura TaxID=36087 RepID=A0A077YZH2_TRITR|nr:hypothetical protein TTRE_0000139701 [Trichuris trichiura]
MSFRVLSVSINPNTHNKSLVELKSPLQQPRCYAWEYKTCLPGQWYKIEEKIGTGHFCRNMAQSLGLKPIRSAALLIAALLVSSNYALLVETCGNNVTKYLDCVDDRFWAALEQQMETEMKNIEEEVTQCFTAYDCTAPQMGDYPRGHGGHKPFGGPHPHGPGDRKPPKPFDILLPFPGSQPPFGRPPRPPRPGPGPFEPPPPPPPPGPGPFDPPPPPLSQETTSVPRSTPLTFTHSSEEPQPDRSSFKKPFDRFGRTPMFITKFVLNEDYFPGSNGQELSETFGECMRTFEDQQRDLFRQCLVEEMPGFVEPKNGIPTQCNVHGGVHRLFQ